MTEIRSTLKRPDAKFILRFHAGQVGPDTISTYLEKGWSLAICCKDCPRTIEWTPAELQRRFGDRRELKIADLVSRLACTGLDGCGSHEVAVFPHLYDGAWNWAPSAEERLL